MPQTLNEIKLLLAQQGIQPKKRFGQNFLHDGNQMRRIMAAAGVDVDDLVLEVGPGTGALTERLLETGARVIAIEVDSELEPILRQRLEPYEECVTLLIDDVLDGKHALNPTLRRLLAAHPFKLVANLPYNVASPLLVNLAIDFPKMRCAVVMVQKEVAHRLAAKPGGKEYGPLTVMIQALCEVDLVGTLPPSCFWPQPTIESAVIRLQRRDEPLTDEPHALGTLLQTLFTRRRKQLGTILGRDAKLPAGVDSKARPETLTVEQLVELSRTQCRS